MAETDSSAADIAGVRRRATIGVIGAGYVGLVAAACFAELGHDVTCVDVDAPRVAMLRRGVLPLHEPGLVDLVRRHLGRSLRFTTDAVAAVAGASFIFLCVPTPDRGDGSPDTCFLDRALAGLLPACAPGTTIVMKSTVPPGTGDLVAAAARHAGTRGVRVVANPEFLSQGTAVRDFLRPDRIVIGADDACAAAAVGRLYAPLEARVIYCSRRAAEMAKYAANALLATRISLMNEIAQVCDAMGVDVAEVAQIAGADRRIGSGHLRPGIGWGGSCLPKDLRALTATARTHACDHALLDAVAAQNEAQRRRVVQTLLGAASSPGGGRVCVLGLTFKPGTDDVRESPAIAIARELLRAGVDVVAHDPMDPAADGRCDELGRVRDPYEAAHGADAVLVATDWALYAALDWRRMRAVMRGRTVVDGRNCLEPLRMRALGFTYVSFGRAATAWGPGSGLADVAAAEAAL